MRRLAFAVLSAFMIVLPAAPAAADHPTYISHYGHGYRPQVTANCADLGGRLCDYTYAAEQSWKNAGFNGWQGPRPWYGCKLNPGYITVCGVSKSSINGNGAYTQGTAVYNPNKHMGHVLIRICRDCGFSETQLRLLIKHEYGHAIGLSHSGDYYSVMYPTVRYDINRHDSDAIRARYNGHGEG